MLSLTSTEISTIIGSLWWPFCRIMGAFMIMPLIGNAYVPVIVRIMLALCISGLIANLLPPVPVVDALSISALYLAVEQLLIGFMLGFILYLLLHVMTILGTIMSMQMGMAMAIMNDPANGDANPILSQWFLLFGTLIFLALDGHLVAIGILIDSFRLWPIGSDLFSLPLMGFVHRLGWLFSASLMLAIPAVLAMLLVNVTFGVLSRSAPSLNIFALGFPMTMLMGLLCVLLSLSGIPSRYSDLCLDALSAMYQFIGGAV
jgi:flagellar biosynthetic protein FliR